MTSLPGFTVDIDHNPYLPAGGRDVSAVVTVTADAEPTDGAPSWSDSADGSAEIIIVDCSWSMDFPPGEDPGGARGDVGRAWTSSGTARGAPIVAGTRHCVARLPDGWVNGGRWTRAPAREAKQAVTGLRSNGGTAIGRWLQPHAPDLPVLPRPRFGHAILLTDGKNQHETPEELAAAIALCEGAFRCDCRGVGTRWKVRELRKISTALLGTNDIVPDPAGLRGRTSRR